MRNDWQSHFSKEALERGYDLLEDDRLISFNRFSDRLIGVFAEDDGEINTDLYLSRNGLPVRPRCSCGEKDCPHVAALLYASEEERADVSDIVPALRKLSGAEIRQFIKDQAELSVPFTKLLKLYMEDHGQNRHPKEVLGRLFREDGDIGKVNRYLEDLIPIMTVIDCDVGYQELLAVFESLCREYLFFDEKVIKELLFFVTLGLEEGDRRKMLLAVAVDAHASENIYKVLKGYPWRYEDLRNLESILYELIRRYGPKRRWVAGRDSVKAELKRHNYRTDLDSCKPLLERGDIEGFIKAIDQYIIFYEGSYDDRYLRSEKARLLRDEGQHEIDALMECLALGTYNEEYAGRLKDLTEKDATWEEYKERLAAKLSGSELIEFRCLAGEPDKVIEALEKYDSVYHYIKKLGWFEGEYIEAAAESFVSCVFKAASETRSRNEQDSLIWDLGLYLERCPESKPGLLRGWARCQEDYPKKTALLRKFGAFFTPLEKDINT